MNQITKTNQEIIELLAQGKTVKEVAAGMEMNRRTVEKRIGAMKKRFKCLTVTQLVVTLFLLKVDNPGANA